MKLKRSCWSMIVFGLMLVMFTGITYQPDHIANAQSGGMLTYGSNIHGTIADATPLIFYNFSGATGDLVHVSVMSMSAGFDPMVDLVAPDQQVLASNDRNSLAFDLNDARVSLVLPQAGVYTLMVGGAGGTTGDFLLTLDGRSPVNSTPLVHGNVMPVSVPEGAPPQYFMFDSALCPTTLTVLEPSAGQPFTFPFIVRVRDSQGYEVARLRGGDTLEDRVTVEAMTGFYEVDVWSDDPMMAGTLSLLVTCGDQPPACLNTGGTAGAGAAGAGGESVAACPECTPCPGVPEEDPGVCGDFEVRVGVGALGSDLAGSVTVNWTEVEGVDHTVLAVFDETTGELIFGQRVEAGITETRFILGWWHLPSGPYSVVVRIYSPESDVALCEETVMFDYLSPEPPEEECEIDIVAPRETIANGLQTIFWTSVPGDVEANVVYALWVYGQFDARVADARVNAPATSLTLDLSEAAIGVGYGGENDFYLQINAFWGEERWCASGVRVTREP